MNFPFFIAKKYLVSKKKQNIINIISGISMAGVMIGTMALVIVLSAYNGMDDLIKKMFSNFDPDIKITAVEGKVFTPDSIRFEKIRQLPELKTYSESIEENALLRYRDRESIAVIKGVDDAFIVMADMDSLIIDGDYVLRHNEMDYAVLGQELAYNLGLGINFLDPIKIYVPKRTAKISLNPANAINYKYIHPSGVFMVQQEYDAQYMLVPLGFARELLDYSKEVSAIEIRLNSPEDIRKVQSEIKSILGNDFSVLNSYEQHAFFYKIMKTEKWAIFAILSFILIIASFNIISSLSMLIIDKKPDAKVFFEMGSSIKQIRRVFLYTGWMISFIGAFAGIVLGYLVCLAQIYFKIIRFPSSGSFIVDAYPMKIIPIDFILIFLVVCAIGFVTSYMPVRSITRKELSN